jgi:hypothetical protein
MLSLLFFPSFLFKVQRSSTAWRRGVGFADLSFYGHDASWHQCSADHGGADRCACRFWACFDNKRTSHFEKLTSTIASPSMTTERTSVSVTFVINNGIQIGHLVNLIHQWTIDHGVHILLGWILLRRCSLHSLGKLTFSFIFVFMKKHHLSKFVLLLTSGWVSWT